MEHWQLIHSATRTSQQLRLARATRVQAESAAKTKEAQNRRQGDDESTVWQEWEMLETEHSELETEREQVELLDGQIRTVFQDALRISLRSPALASFFLRAGRHQLKASRVRAAWGREGVRVPPVAIVSVTNHCNLRCKGCYAQAHHRADAPEMTTDRLRTLVAEADDLGISIMLIAGGEPLTRPEVIDIAAEHPQMVFPLFTNGLLLDDLIVAKLKRHKNIVPVLSLEGHREDTDARRGHGVHEHLLRAACRLKTEGVFFGTSLTVTRNNFATVTDPQYLRDLIDAGCRLFFFVDYVPIQPGTEDLCMTAAQTAELLRLVPHFQADLPGVFVAFPGDEEDLGGCMAAGRGFIHVSPEGRLEPCPFAPFSDTDIRDLPLREALKSVFLRKIRTSGEHLTETRGGCALWARRDWVASLL